MNAIYVETWRRGELARRVEDSRNALRDCQMCGCRCGVNRLAGEAGLCDTGLNAVVSSYGPRFGGEIGWGGVGNIFFSHCNLGCVFCQNSEVSQLGRGHEATAQELAEMMLALQQGGCHNINLVSPSHVAPQIIEGLQIAASRGLSIPLIYNTGGYDSLDALHLLEGVIDIYMPDMKYADEEVGWRYSGVRGYPAINRAAVKEMHRQVGDLKLDEGGTVVSGLVVRHLVLPNGLAGTAETARFLAQEVSRDTYLNITPDYRPCYRAAEFPELSRPVSPQEFLEALDLARQAGLVRLDESHGAFLMRTD
ncbi:MAG: radical SAM protein [Dehalococcoidia bacterium]|nr:radical SAM protein [Dehalococcoidia bacterium]